MFLAEKPHCLEAQNRVKYKKQRQNKQRITFEDVDLDDEESMAWYRSHIESLHLDDISSNNREWLDSDQSSHVQDDDYDSDANSIEEDIDNELFAEV